MNAELLTLPRHIRAARCEAGHVARYDWRIPDLAEALFDEDQYRDPDRANREEGQRLALEYNAVAREVLREYASMERRKKQGRPITRHVPRPHVGEDALTGLRATARQRHA